MPEQTCNPEYVYRVEYQPNRTPYSLYENDDGEVELVMDGDPEPIDAAWDLTEEWACPECNSVLVGREEIIQHIENPGNTSFTP